MEDKSTETLTLESRLGSAIDRLLPAEQGHDLDTIYVEKQIGESGWHLHQALAPEFVSTVQVVAMPFLDLLVRLYTLDDWPRGGPLLEWAKAVSSRETVYVAIEVEHLGRHSTARSLENLYTLREPTEVGRFVKENGFLAPLLTEVHEKLSQYFRSSLFFLEVVWEPEDLLDCRELILSVLVDIDMDPDKADLAMEKFDDEWWLDNLFRADDKLCITLEFR